jgi:uncharacterized protein YjdB
MKKIALLSLLSVVACGPTVKRIAMEPAQAQMSTRGSSLVIHADPKDEKNVTVPDVQLTWASSAPAVATVDTGGRVTAVKSGATVITATAGEIKGTANIRVSIPATLTINPPQIAITGVGQAMPLKAVVKDDTGAAMPPMPIAWTSNDPNVAAVDNGGVVHSMGAGTAAIGARTGPLNASANVTVTLPAFDKLTAQPKAGLKLKVGEVGHATVQATAAGQDVHGVAAKWTSDNEQVATVSAAGEVHGVKKGHANLTATAGAKSDKVKVTVQ